MIGRLEDTVMGRKEDFAFPGASRESKAITWAWSGLIAIGLNIMLFLMMPHLMDQRTSPKTIETLIPDVNVIRMKKPETKVRRKEIKLPPPKQRPIKKPDTTPKQITQPKLTLPFEINPRLPGGPNSLVVPDLKSAPLLNANLADMFSEGQLDAPLTILARIPPVYPLRARNRGIEGWVKVAFIVDETGHVTDISILKSNPEGVFDQSVIRCVSGWRFKPGTVEGMVVKAKAETIIRFELE